MEKLNIPEALKNLMRRSLDTPQFGPYHNEGVLMSAHLGLIMENVEAIFQGNFDFDQIAFTKQGERVLSNEQVDLVRQMVTEAIRQNHEEMKVYAYMHDISKPDCMNIEYQGKKQEIWTMDDYQKLTTGCADEEQIKEAYRKKGVNKIGYRQSEELTQSEERDHGRVGVKTMKELAEKDTLVADFLSSRGLLLIGVEGHEIHFKVFPASAAANKYADHVDGNFAVDDPDRRDKIAFIYASCLIDLISALDEDGKPDFKGFQNMVIARDNFLLIQKIKEEVARLKKEINGDDLKMLMKIKDTAELKSSGQALVEKIKHPPKTALDEEEISWIESQLSSWGLDERQAAEVKNAIRKDSYARVLSKALGKSAGSVIGKIKALLQDKKK